MTSRSKLREQILRLEQGFPQDWIYIEREIKNSLESKETEGVKASMNFVEKSVSDIFHQDIINIYNQKVSKIRPVVGANGAGKTTLLKYHVKDYLDEIASGSNIFLIFDFKAVTDNINEFWSIFVQNLLDQLMNEQINVIKLLISKLDESKIRYELFRIFKNKNLIDNLLKLVSLDPNEHSIAFEYFYSENLDTKTIGDLFNGILKLALQLDFIVLIAFDEIQFLNEIDTTNVLLKTFLEKFIRFLMERFNRERLYILISCLENPREQEWTKLKDQSRNFETIVRGKEIILGNLTSKEKDEIIQQVAEKIGFERKEEKAFLSKVKGSLSYYLPRHLLQAIAREIDSMGYIGYTEYDLRQIYEEDARNYMKDKLKKKGYMHMEPDVKKIGGYNVDIFATAETNRTNYVKKAFGEATIMRKQGMKQKIEKFSDWLYRMKGREYNPDKGDYAFIICPPDRITKNSRQVLEDNNIDLIEFVSLNVDQIEQQGIKQTKLVKEAAIEVETIESAVEDKKLGPLIIVKDEKYKLGDVPGIGPKTEAKLIKAGIHTIKDLLNCNAKIKAKEIDRVGETSINKWKQAARQILYG